MSEVGEAVASEVIQTEVLTCSGNGRINCHPSQYLLVDAVPTLGSAAQLFLLGRRSCEPCAASLQLWYLVLFPGRGCATGVLVPLLHGEAGKCQPCTMCSPSATELAAGWGHACLQLGDTPAFLSPLLVNCMGSHFLNH